MPIAQSFMKTEIRTEVNVLKELSKNEGVEEVHYLRVACDIIAGTKAGPTNKLVSIITKQIENNKKSNRYIHLNHNKNTDDTSKSQALLLGSAPV